MDRREFIRKSSGFAAGSLLNSRFDLPALSGSPDLAVVSGGEPAELVRRAVEELGGMSAFVSTGDVVAVKANISWDRVPAQAATTNPEAVAEVVRLCFASGAKKVKLFDNTLNEARRCYKRSGIEAAAKKAGADVFHIHPKKFKRVRITGGIKIKSWEIYEDVLDADRIINIPVAKHHSISGVSLCMKNYMGWIGGNRGKFHRDFNQKLADLNTVIKADLNIIDAYRMLVRNGPTGGNLADVSLKKTVIAGRNVVAVDACGATLFGHDPRDLAFLQEAEKRNLGSTDLSSLKIQKVSLG